MASYTNILWDLLTVSLKTVDIIAMALSAQLTSIVLSSLELEEYSEIKL